MEHSYYMMIWKVSLFGLLLCVTVDSRPHAISEQSVIMKKGHDDKLSHVGEHKPEHHDKYAWSYPSYEFSYKVKDPKTHDEKGQHESREGDEVKGEYWLIEPDGRKRTVHYHTEKHSGFNAIVEYSGPLHHIYHKSKGEDDEKDEKSSSDKKEGESDESVKESDGGGEEAEGGEDKAEKSKEESKEEEDNGEKGDEENKNEDEKDNSKEPEVQEEDDEDKKEYELFQGFKDFPSFGSRIKGWKVGKDEGASDEEKEEEQNGEEDKNSKKDGNYDHEEDKGHKEKNYGWHVKVSEKKSNEGEQGHKEGYSYVYKFKYSKVKGHDESKDAGSEGDEENDKSQNKGEEEGKKEAKDESNDYAKNWHFDDFFGLKRHYHSDKKSGNGENKSMGEESNENKGLGYYASDASALSEKRKRPTLSFPAINKRRGPQVHYNKGQDDQDREGRSSVNIPTKFIPKTIENYDARGRGNQRFLRTISKN